MLMRARMAVHCCHMEFDLRIAVDRHRDHLAEEEDKAVVVEGGNNLVHSPAPAAGSHIRRVVVQKNKGHSFWVKMRVRAITSKKEQPTYNQSARWWYCTSLFFSSLC